MMYSADGKYSQSPRPIRTSGASAVRPGRGASGSSRNRPRASSATATPTTRFAASSRSKVYCSAAARPKATVDDSERLMKTAQNARSSARSAARRARSATGKREEQSTREIADQECFSDRLKHLILGTGRMTGLCSMGTVLQVTSRQNLASWPEPLRRGSRGDAIVHAFEPLGRVFPPMGSPHRVRGPRRPERVPPRDHVAGRRSRRRARRHLQAVRLRPSRHAVRPRRCRPRRS